MAWSPPLVTIYRERPKIYPCYGDCNPRSSRAAAGSHLGDRNFRSTVGSWRKSRVAREKSKMKAAIRRAQGQSSMRGERIRKRARCHARLYSVRRANGVDRRGYARGQITREEGYGKKKKACRH